jgi:hypothetical protein
VPPKTREHHRDDDDEIHPTHDARVGGGPTFS